jgi:hypothetical protein
VGLKIISVVCAVAIQSIKKYEVKMSDPTIRLLELDSRHAELLERLAALDRQVKEILTDWMQTRESNSQTDQVNMPKSA